MSHPHLNKYPPKMSPTSLISPDAIIDDNRYVSIGDFTWIGPVHIIGHTHVQNLEFQQIMYANGTPEKAVQPANDLYIDHHCWLDECTILPQVTYIAPYTVIGYGAVVAKDILQEGCIWVGNPAKAIRKHDFKRLTEVIL